MDHRNESGLESPHILGLRTDLANGDPDATEGFWREVEGHGAPLVEMLEGQSDALVTFLWRGHNGLRNVVVLGPLVGLDAEQNRLTHLEGSDVWYRTYRLPSNVRSRYWLSPDDPLTPLTEDNWEEILANWRRDPLNPETFRDLWYLSESDAHEVLVSVLTMPDAPPEPWITGASSTPAGTIDEYQIHSSLLSNERRVWVYTPAEHEAEELGAVLFLDGHGYIHLMSAPTILDNLIAAGRIPRLVAIFVDSLGPTREVELPCYPPFADFLADELLPWARERYHISEDPRRVIIVGSSYGGLAATFTGLRRPEVFGNVLSQSGSFWWQPEGDQEYEWLARQFAESPLRPLRFYLDVGRLETDPPPPAPSQLLSNRHLRTVLRAKGYEVSYVEFDGGHDELSWRATLPDGLIPLASDLVQPS